tara:strand:+ start:371 stop:667 length:297 start_codon:yes stop_codon:yes gene_type:complete
MKLKPFGGLVLIKILPEKDEASTMGGIIMPATIDQSRTPRICEIVSIGPEVRNIDPGSRILIPRDAAAMPLDNIIEPDENGSAYALVQPQAILATLHE